MGDLSRWAGLTEKQRVICTGGDSTQQGSLGGFYSWVDQVRDRLGIYFQGNPGYGYVSPWRASSISSDTQQQHLDSNADWTAGAPLAIDRRAPNGESYYRAGTTTATQAIRETKPSAVAIHHFDILYVDAAAAGPIDVSIDGGPYVQHAIAGLGDHQLKVLTVASPVVGNVRCRPHGSTTLIFCGWNLWSLPPLPQACAVHNAARDGGFLSTYTSDAQWLDWYDLMQPQLVLCGPWTNDFGLFITLANYIATANAYEANLQAFVDRVSSYADVLIIAPFGQDRTVGARDTAADNTIQAEFRQRCIDVANANTNVDVLNLFDTFGTYAAGNAAGLLYDKLHENQAGHDLIADLVYARVAAGAQRTAVTPPVIKPASRDILDRRFRGVRTDGFVFNLVAANREPLGGTLEVSRQTTPVVRNDTSRTSYRTVEQLNAYNRPADIDLRRDRLQVLMTLQSGDTFPLGILMFGQNDVRPATRGELWSPQLFDENFILNQGLDRSWSITSGASILGFFVDMVNEVLGPLEIPTSYEVSDQPAGSPIAFPAGSSRLVALKALAALLGCYPPFFANDGTHTLKQAPELSVESTMDHVYELGDTSRIFVDSLDAADSLFNAYNLYVVTGDQLASGVPVRGEYALPAEAPNSIANVGYAVTTSRSVAGLSSADVAAQMAYIDALTDRTSYRRVAFDATADPRHDTFDTLQVLGQKYLETAWSLSCAAGGPHTHEGSGLWLM